MDFALYVSFFPQLVAGPIERAQDMLPQISTERSRDTFNVLNGICLICLGIFKKIVVADNISRLITPVYNQIASVSTIEIIVAAVGFMARIYYDSSGYPRIPGSAVASRTAAAAELHASCPAGVPST